MKLFQKFLLALLTISLVPMILFSLVLLNTTAVTLKEVINRNDINLAENIVREVDKFFVELDSELTVARSLDQSRMNTTEKSQLLLKQITQSQLFSGIFLLDKEFRVIGGMSAESAEEPRIDEELVKKADRSDQVEISAIRQENESASIDVVYPLNAAPRQYVYYQRVKLAFLLNRIRSYLTVGNEKTYKSVLLLDASGNGTSTAKAGTLKVEGESLTRYITAAPFTIALDKEYLKIVGRSRGPQWIVVFQEPADRAYAAISKMRLSAGVLIVFAIGFSFLGALMLARNLISPVRELISGIELVAGGNMDYHVPVVSKDELGKLASIFNSMTDRLKKLQEEMKKAERLSTMGQMANILGHEIRNPLAAISNARYLIKSFMNKMTGVDQKVFKYVDIIENEIKSTEKIINDMLDFSRTRPPVLVQKDLSEFVGAIMGDMKFPEQVTVQRSLPEGMMISVDAEEMKQVIKNLINNAVDSMDNRPEKILTVSAAKTTIARPSGRTPAVHVEIRDTGSGIPKEQLEKIFEPFFSTKAKGTGLGLAVVKRIVQERHNGEIEIESIVGKGTAFRIKLPT